MIDHAVNVAPYRDIIALRAKIIQMTMIHPDRMRIAAYEYAAVVGNRQTASAECQAGYSIRFPEARAKNYNRRAARYSRDVINNDGLIVGRSINRIGCGQPLDRDAFGDRDRAAPGKRSYWQRDRVAVVRQVIVHILDILGRAVGNVNGSLAPPRL